MRRTNPVRQPSPPKPTGRLTGASRQQEVDTNDQLFQRVQEMFEGKVEAEVVYMVLQEFDWNVEKAVDSLSLMCGDVLDPEVKQSKLAEIAKDILLSEKKPQKSVLKTSRVLSASDFPALTPNNLTNSAESVPPAASSQSTSDTDVHFNTNNEKPQKKIQSVSDKTLPSLIANGQTVDNYIKQKAEKISREKKIGLDNEKNIANSDKKAEDFWPKLGDKITVNEQKVIGVIGEHRSRSKGGNSLSPRNRSSDTENRSRSYENSTREVLPSGHLSQYEAWIENKKPAGDSNNTFPSFHSDQQLPSSPCTKTGSKLWNSFDSIDDDDFEEEVKMDLEIKRRHVSGPVVDNQVQQDALGLSILSAALMLSDYSGVNQTENNKSLSNSPVETDNSCADEDITGKVEGESRHNKESGISYLSQMSSAGFWPNADSITFSSLTSSANTSTLGPLTSSANTNTLGPLTSSANTSNLGPITSSANTSTLGPLTSSANTSNLGPSSTTVSKSNTLGKDPFRSSTVVSSESVKDSHSSRYSFAKSDDTDAGMSLVDPLDLDYDDIESLLRTYKEENEESKRDGDVKKDKVVVNSEVSLSERKGDDISVKEMKLPVLSMELSVEAKEFIPRQIKENVTEGTEMSSPKFFLPKMLRQERPIPTSPPRMSLIPPGLPPPRGPYSMPLQQWPPPPPPMNARIPFPRPMGRPPPPIPHFPGFHDPALRGPYASMVMRPGQVLPTRKTAHRPVSLDRGIKAGMVSPEIERVKEKISAGIKCLIILRGLPGSGKSTLAKELEADGCILTTDDYFTKDGQYSYDHTKLSEGHEWNKQRAIMAMQEGFTPIIIDNTNTQAWEMKPYVVQALKYKYDVEILEPNTEWKFSIKDLEKLNLHKVPREKLRQMKDRYQHNLTVESVLGAKDVKPRKTVQNVIPKRLVPGEDEFPYLPHKMRMAASDSNLITKSADRKDSLEGEVTLDNDLGALSVCRSVEEKTETRYSPIPGNVVRPAKGVSPVNLHKQLEMISARKMLMSPPVAAPSTSKSVRNQGEATPEVKSRQASEGSSKTDKGKSVENEVDSMVNDLIKDQIGNSVNENFDFKKATEELKAFLHIMPIEPENRPQVEAVIDKKMNEIMNSFSAKDTSKGGTSKNEVDARDENSNVQQPELITELGTSKGSVKSVESESSELNDKESRSDKNSGRKPHKSSESKSSNDSELDLERIEDSAIMSDIDTVSSISGEMEKLSLAAQMFESTVRQGQGQIMLMEEDGFEEPKPQRERRTRNHSQPRDDADGIGNDKKDNSDSITESCTEKKVGVLDVDITDSEAKYWGQNIGKESSTRSDVLEKQDMDQQDNTLESVTTGQEENSWHDPKPQREAKNQLRTRNSFDNVIMEVGEGEITDESSDLEDIGALLVEKLKSSSGDDSNLDNGLYEKELGSFEEKRAINSPSYKQKNESNQMQISIGAELSSKSSSASISPKSSSVSPKEEVDQVFSEPSQKKNKKSSRRKMAANLPFLKEDDKKLFNDTEWGKFNVKATSPEKIKIPKAVVAVKVQGVNMETQVSSDDFRLVNCIENGLDIKASDSENFIHILPCHMRDIQTSRESSTIPCGESSALETDTLEKSDILTIDRGTLTEESFSVSEENVEFLRQGFPNIPVEDLKDILLQCGNNIQWALDLILDWHYKIDLSEEDRVMFVNALRKVNPEVKPSVSLTPVSPTNVPGPSKLFRSPRLVPKSHLSRQHSSGHIQPLTLVDTCVKFLNDNYIIHKEDIERQMITSAEQRLKSIEENIRVTRQHSVRSVSVKDEMFEDDDDIDEQVMQELLAIAEREIQHYNETADDFWKVPKTESNNSDIQVNSEEPSVPNGDIDSSITEKTEAVSTVQRQSSLNEVGYRYTVPNIDTDSIGEDLETERYMNSVEEVPSRGLTDVEERSTSVNNTDVTDREDDMETALSAVDRESPLSFTLPLEIPRDFTLALISLFGPVQKDFLYTADNVRIQVDYNTAMALHRCLSSAETPPKTDLNQLKKDEEMARKLQSEMDRMNRPPTLPSLHIPSRHPVKVWSNPGPPHTTSTQAVSLVDIMEEQQVAEHRIRQYDGESEAVDEDTATGASASLFGARNLKKLCEEFPGIDESVVNDIYQANGCSYEDSRTAIQGSLDRDYNPPKTVRNEDAAKKYQTKLIEAAKQQSLSEMLNSCLYHSRYQNSENPEYDDIRGEANLHYRLRHECFQKAQEANRRGMREVASFYSHQGHLHTKKIKEANMRAAETILAQRNNFLENSSTIDLHGLHVDEAQTILKQVLAQRELELQLCPDKRKRQLFIITGRGNHSRGGVARLKPAVINFLKQSQYRFTQVHQGMLKVQFPVQ